MVTTWQSAIAIDRLKDANDTGFKAAKNILKSGAQAIIEKMKNAKE